MHQNDYMIYYFRNEFKSEKKFKCKYVNFNQITSLLLTIILNNVVYDVAMQKYWQTMFCNSNTKSNWHLNLHFARKSIYRSVTQYDALEYWKNHEYKNIMMNLKMVKIFCNDDDMNKDGNWMRNSSINTLII